MPGPIQGVGRGKAEGLRRPLDSHLPSTLTSEPGYQEGPRVRCPLGVWCLEGARFEGAAKPKAPAWRPGKAGQLEVLPARGSRDVGKTWRVVDKSPRLALTD